MTNPLSTSKQEFLHLGRFFNYFQLGQIKTFEKSILSDACVKASLNHFQFGAPNSILSTPKPVRY